MKNSPRFLSAGLASNRSYPAKFVHRLLLRALRLGRLFEQADGPGLLPHQA
jgi:hypothetical protein